jgi:hypothetical protein
MGSVISKIYDLYEDYVFFCKMLSVNPKSIENYKNHEKEICEKYGYIYNGTFYEKK